MDKIKYPASEARAIGEELISLFKEQNAVEWVCIAGSLRRERPEVGDVEILYIPRVTEGADPSDLFGTPRATNHAENLLQKLLSLGVVKMRPNVEGHFTWGPKNKLTIHVASGIPVDFFATTQANKFVSLVIRTGGKDMNIELTTGANKKNLTLNAYGSGVTNRATGAETPATSEQHVFELCGVEYKEPKFRK